MKRFDRHSLSGNPRFICCIACSLLLGLCGCFSAGALTQEETTDAVARTSFWEPFLLFIHAAPYPRLYVEVDAVEGVAPDDESLRPLRDFLAAYCDKPAGIRVVRDTVIPRAEARGVAPGVLARKHLRGPDHDTGAPPTAFMYVLFFDAALSRETGVDSAQDIVSTDSLRLEVEPINPVAQLLPYPAAVFADPLFNGRFRNASSVWKLFGPVLQHEAGHLLGLSRNPTHAADMHCRKSSCLMHPRHGYLELLAGDVQTDLSDSNIVRGLRLCADCEAEIRAHALAPNPFNLKFVGPVLVRSEDGYHVLALPQRLALIVGRFEEQDAWEFARSVQSDVCKPREPDVLLVAAVVKPEARQDRARLMETLQRARQDPYGAVREAAEGL